MSGLISYTDSNCEYSLFVSYAHRDDSGNDDWITTLKNAIYDRFDQMKDGIPHKAIHFSKENGPVAGTLGHLLKDRVKRSFAMLLVVGKQYVDSKWCEKELALFDEVFPDGQESRLNIAVMGEKYLTEVKKGTTWQRVVADDQLWTSMFQERDPDNQLEHRLASGQAGYPPDFRRQAHRLADKLIKVIEADWSASEALANTGTADYVPSKAKQWVSSSNKQRLCVAVAPHTETFDAVGDHQPFAVLKQTLESAGAEVYSVNREKLFKYKPNDGQPLRGEFARADVLLAPLIDELPLRPDLIGGHTSIIAKEWAALNKPPKSLIWYRPPVPENLAVEPAELQHLDAFKTLAPVCTSPQAVVNLLYGAGTSDQIRVYIENHDVIPAYSLGEAIEKQWAWLRAGAAPEKLPNLRCIPIRISDLDDALEDVQDDVAAFVLLDVKGYTANKSLRVRERLVEERFPKPHGFYPGIVALVFTPPPSSADAKPNHLWGDVTFYRTSDSEVVLDEHSQGWLRQFLNQMWRQHQASQH